jgi:hypothetical protein
VGWGRTSTYSHDSSPVVAQNLNVYVGSAVSVSDVLNNDWGTTLLSKKKTKCLVDSLWYYSLVWLDSRATRDSEMEWKPACNFLVTCTAESKRRPTTEVIFTRSISSKVLSYPCL